MNGLMANKINRIRVTQVKRISMPIFIAMLLAVLATAGCSPLPDKTPQKAATETKSFEPAAQLSSKQDAHNGSEGATESNQPTPAALLAKINGKPLLMESLHEVLVQDYGLPIARQLIADELVRCELEKQNLPVEVTASQIEIENRRAMSKILPPENAPSPEQMESLLPQLLAQRNITRRMYFATMARNARLARLAAKRVTVTEDDISYEFFTQYDGKYRVRHIQVPDAGEAEKILRKIEAGEDFEQLARKYSTNPSRKTGGWLPDIGPRSAPDIVPPVLRENIRALKKPGQVSNIVQVGTNYHILKLEEIVPPGNVKFEDVKDRLRDIVRDKKIDLLQMKIMQELFRNATIEYINPTIRAQSMRGSKP